MRTLAIINQKGGCGKTTTAINLSASLARLGHKTLLVDMDPQGHCATGLAVPEERVRSTILDCLLEPGDVGPDARTANVSEIAWQIATNFDLAPSNLKLAGFEQIFAGRPGRERRLADALSTASDHYEWCILDCPPGVGLLTFNALVACDEAIIPVETGYFSLHGLAKMLETIEELKDKSGKDVVVRVLPTLYDTRTKLAREVLAELRGRFADVLMRSCVSFNVKLKEAASFGQPITEYDPGSRGYKDFVDLARELMGQEPVSIAGQDKQNLSRPEELVRRAQQLSQFSAKSFGRTVARPPAAPTPQPADVPGSNGQSIFAARFPGARVVRVAGDFNDWQVGRGVMTRGSNDVWSCSLPVAPGKYRYRFVVDGRWTNDPTNQQLEQNDYGEFNNVLVVPAPAAAADPLAERLRHATPIELAA
jgi:chromosome partitioning protein